MPFPFRIVKVVAQRHPVPASSCDPPTASRPAPANRVLRTRMAGTDTSSAGSGPAVAPSATSCRVGLAPHRLLAGRRAAGQHADAHDKSSTAALRSGYQSSLWRWSVHQLQSPGAIVDYTVNPSTSQPPVRRQSCNLRAMLRWENNEFMFRSKCRWRDWAARLKVPGQCYFTSGSSRFPGLPAISG